jgi:Na+/H+ antiporter NhaD/arsenite permease-like protein
MISSLVLFASSSASAAPPSWLVLPFILLLLSIALLPLFAAHFWEHRYPIIAVALGSITTLSYVFLLQRTEPLLHAVTEYLSFMALVGSLFVISGGINIRVKGSATPWVNVVFLALGAVLANLIGTTGASMLLIRPWIRMNKVRMSGMHVVFFIFIVSNCGGALTPIGDPPLFIGFLRGVPFWWTLQHAWQPWLVCVGLLLLAFLMLDLRSYGKAAPKVQSEINQEEWWAVRGVWNVIPLAMVLGAVFIDPNWHVGPITMSALVMVAAAILSYSASSKDIHEANDFNFGPVKEVGWLFIGIFLTMIPALELLQGGHGPAIHQPIGYYLATGSLSALLDNAPTYLAFLATAMGQVGADVNSTSSVLAYVSSHPSHLLAISLGAVFFGAGTYIGNGPNFMVKAITEKAGVHTPNFLSYIACYTLPILLPILVFVGWLYFA